jgi:hypothetical protein
MAQSTAERQRGFESSLPPLLYWTQGLYYAGSALWPILHYRSFEAVTGKKTDVWLVKTVATFILVIATVITAGAHWWRGAGAVLAALSCVAFIGIDSWYAFRRVISRVYLLDAALEVLLLAGWVKTALHSLRISRAGSGNFGNTSRS